MATVSAGKNGVMKLYKSGSTSLKVTDGTLLTPHRAGRHRRHGTATFDSSLAASTTTLTAGGSDNLTITALDTYGNTATAYTGSKNLTFSGASASPSNRNRPSPTAAGTGDRLRHRHRDHLHRRRRHGLLLQKRRDEDSTTPAKPISTSATARSPANRAARSDRVRRSPRRNSCSPPPRTTPAAGEADNLTVTAQDTYGNVATSYTGSKSLTFSGASASPGGQQPDGLGLLRDRHRLRQRRRQSTSAPVSPPSAATKNGVMKLYKIGSTTINVSDGTFTTANVTLTVARRPRRNSCSPPPTTTPVAAAANNLTITAQDPYENTVTAYTGAKNLTFSGASASPNGDPPTVANSSGTAINFGTATAITFTSGVATVTSTKNGMMKLYRAGLGQHHGQRRHDLEPHPDRGDRLARCRGIEWGITNINISAGALGSNCLFTCTLTGLGNSGTVKARVAVTDSLGNTVSAVGAGHGAKITLPAAAARSAAPRWRSPARAPPNRRRPSPSPPNPPAPSPKRSPQPPRKAPPTPPRR